LNSRAPARMRPPPAAPSPPAPRAHAPQAPAAPAAAPEQGAGRGAGRRALRWGRARGAPLRCGSAAARARGKACSQPRPKERAAHRRRRPPPLVFELKHDRLQSRGPCRSSVSRPEPLAPKLAMQPDAQPRRHARGARALAPRAHAATACGPAPRPATPAAPRCAPRAWSGLRSMDAATRSHSDCGASPDWPVSMSMIITCGGRNEGGARASEVGQAEAGTDGGAMSCTGFCVHARPGRSCARVVRGARRAAPARPAHVQGPVVEEEQRAEAGPHLHEELRASGGAGRRRGRAAGRRHAAGRGRHSRPSAARSPRSSPGRGARGERAGCAPAGSAATRAGCRRTGATSWRAP
jgi:hypothetical protein